jgi:hypothetical protein
MKVRKLKSHYFKTSRQEFCDRVIELYNSGVNAPDLAAIVGCHRNTVYTILEVSGVKARRGRPLGSYKVKKGVAA